MLMLAAVCCVVIPVNGQKAGEKNNTQQQSSAKPQTPKNDTINVDTVNINKLNVTEQTNPPDKSDKNANKSPSYFRRLIAPENLPNLILCFAGTAGVIAAIYTLRAINRQADLMENSLIAVQRAFIFFRGMDTTGMINASSNKVIEWHVQLQWENSGTTPSKDLEMLINWQFGDKPIPIGFDFPNHAPEVPYVLGPKATVFCGPVKIPVAVLLGIQQGTVHAYIWGTARYRDVFKGTPQHVTKFCWKITGVLGDPTTQNMTFTWAAHEEHNCADEDCN